MVLYKYQLFTSFQISKEIEFALDIYNIIYNGTIQ